MVSTLSRAMSVRLLSKPLGAARLGASGWAAAGPARDRNVTHPQQPADQSPAHGDLRDRGNPGTKVLTPRRVPGVAGPGRHSLARRSPCVIVGSMEPKPP